MTYQKRAAKISTGRMRANGGTIRINRRSEAEKVILRMVQEGTVELIERQDDDSSTYRLKPAQTEAQP